MRLATSCEWRIDMYTVYMHRNKINGKIYIGITGKSPEVRWQNGNGYSQRHFGRAIKKYGWENFDHIILFTGLTKEEACQKEIELIEKYDATNSDKGYNIAKGGEINCGYHISEERKKYLSELNKGERHPQYHKPKSDITRKRMSEARKGKPFSEKHRKQREPHPTVNNGGDTRGSSEHLPELFCVLTALGGAHLGQESHLLKKPKAQET